MTGRLLPMIKNMAAYAMEAEACRRAGADELIAALEQALKDNTYLVLAPQFVVTAVR
jgi:hypothetical protein